MESSMQVRDAPLKPKDINNDGSMRSRKRSSTERSSRTNPNLVDQLKSSSRFRRDPSKKSVHWNPKVAKKRHIQVKDMKAEERQNVWYNTDDTKIILAMAKVTVKMMMKGEQCDDIDYCSRGLEGKTLNGSRKRNKYKQLARSAVLMEQEIQRMDGVNKPEELARVSCKHTEILVAKARVKAIQDERDAKEFLLDVDTHISRTIQQRDQRMEVMEIISEGISA